MAEKADSDPQHLYVSQCLHTLAQDNDTPVHFQDNFTLSHSEFATLNPGQWLLPALTEHNQTLCRGIADHWGLCLRLHNPTIHYQQRPQGRAGIFIDQLEKIRILCLGSRWMGIGTNLNAWLNQMYGQSELSELDAAYLMIGEMIAPQLIDTRVNIQLAPFRTHLQPLIVDFFAGFKSSVDHQSDWQALSIKLARRLDILDDPNPEQDQADPEQGGAEQESQDQEQAGFSQDDNQSSSQEDDEDQLHPPMATPLDEQQSDTGDGTLSLNDQALERMASTGQTMALSDYVVYQRKYDEVIEAYKLCDHKELLRLRRLLDQHLEHTSETVNQLSQQLKRRLLSHRPRSQLHSEHGILNHQRLARVVIDPFHSDIYLNDLQHPQVDTALTLLIDNSGSMRGRSIRMAAMCADILGQTLARCQVKLEILGFTTRTWKGGQARLDWQAANQPVTPGRMNELRHIIYKPFNANFRKSRAQLGLMLRESLLKENIDGEALLWACQRLYRQAVNRRILVVISDGAPVDDSTLANNSKDYLERHLRAVIGQIEAQKRIELLAIGIGHDVRDYYQHAVMLNDPAKLGEVLLTELTELLVPKR